MLPLHIAAMQIVIASVLSIGISVGLVYPAEASRGWPWANHGVSLNLVKRFVKNISLRYGGL